MFLNFLLFGEDTWYIPLILQGITYFLLFRKMDIPQLLGFVPGFADWRLTKELFPRTRVFWRPFLTTTLLVACAAYLNPFSGTGRPTARIFLWIAIFVYEIFLFRLYMRLGKSFGKGRGILFGIAAALLPPVFISLLALNKNAQYTPPVFPPQKQHGKFVTFLGRFAQGLISVVEAAALIAVVGFFTVRAYPPRILASYLTNDILTKTQDITGGDKVVTREETMGDAAANLASMPASRDKFFPDHSQDKSVVVIEYIIGSDLEDRAGLASANIKQMIEATKQGSALTFVLQVGGSQRWFVDGIKDGTYARYIVHDGKLEKVQDLSNDICMSEPENLADFLSWAKESYPADRYMLAFWDHGGGFGTGYGYDALNKRDADVPILGVDELVDAVDKCGLKFDVIGFDACLMQDIEVAAAFEPYADYFLASEEVEGGFGWFYTSAFGKLAQNPGMSSEDFGREIVACYDPYNTIIKDDEGKPDTQATLSFVDLPLAKAAYQQMEGFFADAHEAMLQGSSTYADLSLAGTSAYTFGNSEQVDLINFLDIVTKLDYNDAICTDEEGENLINSVKACVLYRNADSADGINGMALTFPVKSISAYKYDYNQFNHFSFVPQRDFYNDFFSIMAAQKKKSIDSYDPDNATLSDFLAYMNDSMTDMSDQEWYVQGFEDYDNTPAFLNIPLIEMDDYYKIDLPQEAWDIVANEQLIVYQKREDGLKRYLGTDVTGGVADENGNLTVAMDGTWVHVGGHLCAYTPGEVRSTDQGNVFTGTTLARLNGENTIKLYIEWLPMNDESTEPYSGRIVGYDDVDFEAAIGFFTSMIENNNSAEEFFADAFLSKGKNQLQPGDRLEFLFDIYDDQGELVETEALGNLIVSNQERIEVADLRLEPCDVIFGGVLTDVYQRIMTTELIEATIK